MKTESSTGDRSLTVSTFVRAGPATVFGILADPERFSAWIQGVAEFEPRPGSPFTIDFPQFETVIRGEVVAVETDRRVVFTWGVAEGEQHAWFPEGSSTLSIELAEEDGGTRVTLTHADLPEREVKPHHDGWRFHLSRMDLWANRVQLTDRFRTTLRAWRDAWEESDDDRRASLLKMCCVDGVIYADEYAELEGRDRLSTHIANTIRFVPFTRVVTETPRVCHGSALIDWRLDGDDGQSLQRGTLHVDARPDGRFTSVTSFQQRA